VWLLANPNPNPSPSPNPNPNPNPHPHPNPNPNPNEVRLLALVVLWCGVVVNAIASFLQVGGQQAIGPARAQVLYAPPSTHNQEPSDAFTPTTLSVKRHKRRRTKSACREG